MNKIKSIITVALLLVSGIFLFNFSVPEPTAVAVCLELPTELHAPIDRDGKFADAEKLGKVFSQSPWEALGFPVITDEVKLALQHQLRVLESSPIGDGRKLGNLEVSYGQLKEVIEILLQRSGTQPNDLNQYLEAWQSWGDDRLGDVYFTGYFTPSLKVKKTKDSKFKYPIYAFPEDWEGPMPSRKQIDAEGALSGLGLELGYAANPVDVYIMHLQGSGTVEFVDTKERMLFRYAGENGHRYRNIQRFFRNRDDLALSNLSTEGISRFLTRHPELTDSVLFYNPSYTFFTPKKGLAKGAGEVPLLETISIAADPRYFPMGSVVLAAMPVFHNGKITHHQYQILLPQDVGGAIKGAGHVDVYCGNGELGRKRAASLHHYGRLWVLMPKKNEQVAMVE
ncbi:MAG: MltA domain-containing protein [Bacteroidetes bacterium]|nr:MltA domain-containing protein [Bacteroidota bacterium]